MTDLGDTELATLVVDPFDGTTDAQLEVFAPDGSSTTTPAPTTSDGGQTWTRPVTYDQPYWWLLSWTVTGTGAGVTHQRVYVTPAPLVPPALPIYANLGALKHARRITHNNEDEALLRALQVSARAIDRKCHRQFWLDEEASVRRFRTRGRRLLQEPGIDGALLLVDDIGNLDDLVVEVGKPGDWRQLDPAEFETEPLRSPSNRRPVTALREVPPLRWCDQPQAQVTVRWGWPVTPVEVSEANLILANRIYLRKDSPEGVAGSAEWGMLRLSRWDPDVETLLAEYILPDLEE